MTLITRLTRLFRADFHAVLDRIEEPELLLRQAIREMEDELARQEQAIRLATHEEGEYAARRAHLGERLAEIEEELDLCFSSGKEALARGLVKRKLETQRLGKHLASRQEALTNGLARRQATLAENRAALDSLRQKAELVAIRAQADGDPDDGGFAEHSAREPVVTAEEVEVAFLRERQARNRS
jgi:phage shock protein A